MLNHNSHTTGRRVGNGTQPSLRRESGPMSALGHKRTFAVQKARSAFDPKADTNSVRHGPSMIDSVRPPPNQNMPAPNAAADQLRPSRPEVQFSPGRVHRLDPRQPTPSR